MRPAVGAHPEDRAVGGAGEDPALGVDDDVLGAVAGDRDDVSGVVMAGQRAIEQGGVTSRGQEARHEVPAGLAGSRPGTASGATKTIWRPSPSTMSASVREVAATQTVKWQRLVLVGVAELSSRHSRRPPSRRTPVSSSSSR